MKKIILSLSLVLIYLMSSLVFANDVPAYINNNNYTPANTKYNVSQEEMLKVVYESIHGTSTLAGNQQYCCKVYCSPAIYLEAGNCFIDWVEYRNQPYTKDTSFEAAIQKYSLKVWPGTYNLYYDNNKITIQLTNPMNVASTAPVKRNDPFHWINIPGPENRSNTQQYYTNPYANTNDYSYTAVRFHLYNINDKSFLSSTSYFRNDLITIEIQNYINELKEKSPQYVIIDYQYNGQKITLNEINKLQ